MYIVFSSAPTVASYAIRMATASQWSHVDMLWEDGTLIGSVSHQQGPYSPGVQKLTLEERLRYSNLNCYRIDKFDLRDEWAARQYAEAQLGKPYDWGGAFGIPIWNGRNWQQDSRWFCSELIAACAVAGATPLIRMQTYRVTPEMVERSPLLEPHSDTIHR